MLRDGEERAGKKESVSFSKRASLMKSGCQKRQKRGVEDRGSPESHTEKRLCREGKLPPFKYFKAAALELSFHGGMHNVYWTGKLSAEMQSRPESQTCGC